MPSPSIKSPLLLHASCVVWRGHGLLLRGASGAGKSDLALRLIDRGAELVADDLVQVEADGPRLWAAPLAQGAGLLEVRGVGVLRFPFVEKALLSHVVELGDVAARLPDEQTVVIESVSLPFIVLSAFEASAVAKILAWLERPMVVGAQKSGD